MKRVQNYEVTITHKAHAKVLVRAVGPKDAKETALEMYNHNADIELINDEKGDQVTKVKCLGAAGKRKNAGKQK